MTVIFHTNAGVPALAGDMLISTPSPKHSNKLKLPSHPNGIVIPSNLIPKSVPIAMRRKIFVVNEHLAVGAAGKVASIRAIIHHLFGAFGDKPSFSSAELEDSIMAYASTPKGQDAFKGAHLFALAEATDRTGLLDCTARPTAKSETVSRTFGTVSAIGSGSGRVLDQIRTFDGYAHGSSQPQDRKEKFPEVGPLATNLGLLAGIYWRELVSPRQVFDAWGGAYDLIYQDSNRVFRHLTDYTLVVRVCDIDDPDGQIWPRGIMKYERQRDVSYIAMLTQKGLEFFAAKDITAPAGPATVKLAKGKFTMSSKFHVSVIEVRKGDEFITLMTQVEGLPDEQSKSTMLTWFDEEGRLSVWFRSDHDEWLRGVAMEAYSQRTNALSG